ncbi:G-protein coupled receptor family C group 5 member D [Hyla sarda]|uniref:G-protein coupled receptor family C group 5 member D n=1 Tax=Hyla sarda TaxID=327740 RepID=UPI0024C312B9|nr:G-protein coupled receptor family C group 5 member D [Hyla sarda]XP_056384046.1 G-protein coupled receptor family C group 5 member D [Hyla sarda]XP_056384047.1 G-protein coupled receptor family C group 5 member D [Hyla sarda]XP_056384048.1 G-protein coupled receptor family C group 5 member D [Hyla sarda]
MSCDVGEDFIFLCSAPDAWGIVVETLAAAGILFTFALMLSLLILVRRICDNCKRDLVPIQFTFLIATLGIFGLTFAFIVRLNIQTCPTRFFLFGVLFAICFSCLLVHASKLVRLVRGGSGMSWWAMIIMLVALSLVQIIIAILYVAIYLGRNMNQCDRNLADLPQRNIDFVLILVYVMALMAVTLLVSMAAMCGPCKHWKPHGAHIYITMFFSIAIWVTWIVMLLRGNISLGTAPQWDDPVRAIALVANGWVFLLMYMVPELCLMTRHTPSCCKQIQGQSQPHLIRQSVGIENRVFTQEDISQVQDSGRCSPSSTSQYDATLALRDMEPAKEFSIPRPQPRPDVYLQYRTHDLTEM